MALDLNNYVESIPDYPEKGIIFRDITPLMADGEAFAPARKAGKLPRETVEAKYDLEYGTSALYMHKDAIKPGQKVLIVDDLLATGGTIGATIDLVEQLGGEVVGCAFIIELKDLNGRKRIKDYDTLCLMEY